MVELPTRHSGVRNGGGRRIGVSDNAASFLRHEEESLVALLVDFRNPDGAADSAAEVVITQRRTFHDGVGAVVEKSVGVQNVVAEKLINASVNVAGTGARDDIDLPARRAAGL